MEFCKKKVIGFIINMWDYVCSLVGKLIRRWMKKDQEVPITKDNDKKRPANKFRRKKEKLPQLSIAQLEKLKALF